MSFDPTGEQRAVIESDDSALVVAGPGRGKTAMALAAASAWLDRHRPPDRVLFTSFSNAAVQRIASAAGIRLARHRGRVQFRTFHSVALEVLRDYGRFVGLAGRASVLDKTEEHLLVAERGWDPADSAYQETLRAVARETGRTAFDLMVPLTLRLLRTSPLLAEAVAARFPFIVVDEFQDTKPEQWDLLKLLGHSGRVLALGDPNQMIYSAQYAAALERFAAFCRWKGTAQVGLQRRNFRCDAPDILDLAEALLTGARCATDGGSGVQLFPAYYPQRRAALAVIWKEVQRQAEPGSTLAFIVPSDRVARELASDLRTPNPSHKAPIPIYARIETREGWPDTYRLALCAATDYADAPSDGRRQTLAASLAVFVSTWSKKKLTDTLVRQIEAALRSSARKRSPLREFLRSPATDDARVFAGGLLEALKADELSATAARDLERQGIPDLEGCLGGPRGNLFAAYRASRSPAGLDGMLLLPGRTTMLSMYRAKGREFDFVVMVIDPRAHSSKTTLDELRRLYYVSATRARRWLGVLYPPNDPGSVLGPVIGK
jgi:hypothetical protein